MPPCRFELRSLLVGSRSFVRPPLTTSILPVRQSQWRPILRHYGTDVAENRDEGNDAGFVKVGGASPNAQDDSTTGSQYTAIEKREKRALLKPAQPRTEIERAETGYHAKEGHSTGDAVNAVHSRLRRVEKARKGGRISTDSKGRESSQISVGDQLLRYTPLEVPPTSSRSARHNIQRLRLGARYRAHIRTVAETDGVETPLRDGDPASDLASAAEQALKRSPKSTPHHVKAPACKEQDSSRTSVDQHSSNTTTAKLRYKPLRSERMSTTQGSDTEKLTGAAPRTITIRKVNRPREAPGFRIPYGKVLERAMWSQLWIEGYRKLDKRYAPKSPNTYLQDPGPPRLLPGTEAIAVETRSRLQKAREPSEVDEAASGGSDPTNLIPFLLRKSFSFRNFLDRWNSIALWFLYHDPEHAIEFLAASSASKLFPLRQNVGFSMRYLVLHFCHCQDINTRIDNMKKIARHLALLLDQTEVLRLHFTQAGTIRHLIPYWTSDEIDALWLAIQNGRLVTSWQTLLHLARHFIDNEQFSAGLDAILAAKDLDATVDSWAFRSSCAHLLRVASRQPSGLRVTLRLVDNFVAMGLTLNLQMCNIVILNAIDAGDLNTAFALYRSLVQNGLEADHCTYGILLKGCRGIGDAALLNETIRSAIAHVNVQKHERLAAEILHCLNVFHFKKDPDSTFSIIADAYTQLFDTHPLRMLGILEHSPRAGVERRMPPNQQVMGIMLSSYLNHVHLQTKTFHAAREVYDRYRELVLAGTEPFASSISSDYFPNLFLQTFIRTEQGLLSASQVIKDMQRPTEDAQRVQQCPPSVQSWTIFAHGFTRHGKMDLAEQVLKYMRNKGLQPDYVTWNVLVKGYAARQDEQGLLTSLNRMEDAGHEWTQGTLAGMRWYRKQDRLAEVLKRKEQKVLEYDFVADLKEQLRQRFQEDENGYVEYKPFGE